jgi:hypothetical protein
MNVFQGFSRLSIPALWQNRYLNNIENKNKVNLGTLKYKNQNQISLWGLQTNPSEALL